MRIIPSVFKMNGKPMILLMPFFPDFPSFSLFLIFALLFQIFCKVFRCQGDTLPPFPSTGSVTELSQINGSQLAKMKSIGPIPVMSPP